ncbi:hypothetical protein [Pseudomonas sp.]|uniref:hypothetical protein n=1 Tax=Pseudomonas sp. TaxID=306 RepID=UPI002E30ABA8|nr:hypothetical protein [Pseudomonas sp.]HEX4550103.1 hypothetical protein [Pseudomonas sp.]
MANKIPETIRELFVLISDSRPFNISLAADDSVLLEGFHRRCGDARINKPKG